MMKATLLKGDDMKEDIKEIAMIIALTMLLVAGGIMLSTLIIIVALSPFLIAWKILSMLVVL